MAALVGDTAGPQRAAAVFGFVTFVFGIGQMTGPFCAGALAEMTGGFTLSFSLATLLGLSAALLSSMLPGPSGRKK
jgi:MFS family permease